MQVVLKFLSPYTAHEMTVNLSFIPEHLNYYLIISICIAIAPTSHSTVWKHSSSHITPDVWDWDPEGSTLSLSLYGYNPICALTQKWSTLCWSCMLGLSRCSHVLTAAEMKHWAACTVAMTSDTMLEHHVGLQSTRSSQLSSLRIRTSLCWSFNAFGLPSEKSKQQCWH